MAKAGGKLPRLTWLVWTLFCVLSIEGANRFGVDMLHVRIVGAALLMTSVHCFTPWSMRRFVHRTVPALHALEGSRYKEEFVTKLSSDLSLQPETTEKLRRHRVPELTLLSLSRHELQEIFDIALDDAVLISTWFSVRLKEEEKAERTRLKEGEIAERTRLKEEEMAERTRLKKLKLDQSKHVRIFNEADMEYADISFSDQISLQTFLSGSRIPALALVDANRTSSLLITAWEHLVNNSCYAPPPQGARGRRCAEFADSR
jgi:hypothetical protein